MGNDKRKTLLHCLLVRRSHILGECPMKKRASTYRPCVLSVTVIICLALMTQPPMCLPCGKKQLLLLGLAENATVNIGIVRIIILRNIGIMWFLRIDATFAFIHTDKQRQQRFLCPKNRCHSWKIVTVHAICWYLVWSIKLTIIISSMFNHNISNFKLCHHKTVHL